MSWVAGRGEIEEARDRDETDTPDTPHIDSMNIGA